MLRTGQGFAPLAFLLRSARFLRRWRLPEFTEAAIDRAYAAWAWRDVPRQADWTASLAALKDPPRFSIVMPVHNTRPDWLRAALASVRAQFFAAWELHIVDDGSTDPQLETILRQAAADDARIEVIVLSPPGGVTAATNAGLRRASGDYVAFLDHDDVLAPHALAAMACAIAENRSLDLLFSDEDQLVNGRRAAPYFKPGFNPDLLLAQNAICHLAVYRRALLARLGFLRAGYDGSQDHDLALRAVRETPAHRIRHIPQVLYHWRQSAASLSSSQRDACRAAAQRAITDHLHGKARVTAAASLPWPALRFRVPTPLPNLSVIGGEIAGAQNVASAAAATGEILLFLSPALRPVSPDWLDVLLAHTAREGVGAAGARLTGPDGRLLHAGYWLDPVAVAVSPEAAADDPGYRGHFRLARTVSAVSLDCLAIRRDVFLAAGGLEPQAGDFAAVDLCLRLAARGLRSVWDPAAWLHYEAPPPAPSAGAAWMRNRWAEKLGADPYANPNLTLRHGRLGLRAPA